MAALVAKAPTGEVSLDHARLFLAEAISACEAKDSLTVPEAAERLGVCTKTIYTLVSKGQLDCIRVGRTIRIPPEALRKVQPTSIKPKRAVGFQHF